MMNGKDILFVVKPGTSIEEVLPQVAKYLEENDMYKSLGIYPEYGEGAKDNAVMVFRCTLTVLDDWRQAHGVPPDRIVNGPILDVIHPFGDSTHYTAIGQEELDKVTAYEVV